MGLTVGTFFVTAAIAAVIMYVIVRLCPVVTGDYTIVEGEVSSTLSVTDMIINFFTKPDFGELWSRKAILPSHHCRDLLRLRHSDDRRQGKHGSKIP